MLWQSRAYCYPCMHDPYFLGPLSLKDLALADLTACRAFTFTFIDSGSLLCHPSGKRAAAQNS